LGIKLKKSERDTPPKRESTLSKSKKLTGCRKWFFFFVLTVITPALLFLLLEISLRIIGYGYHTDFFIPRQVEGKQVFTDNMKFTWRFFRPELARPSCHLSIPAEKSSDTFRIFVLGGSAAMGDPDFSFGFSRMLEVMLQHQYPDVRFEVINAAITAINSNVVLPISRDCAKLKPDLFIVYLGNNEVIGPFGPGTVFAPFLSGLGFIRVNIFLKSTKIGQLVNSLKQRLDTDENSMQTWGGMGMFVKNQLRFNDKRMAGVYEHFRDNLADICNVGHRAGAKIIVCTVPTNLKNCAPFGSLHRQSLTDASTNEWDRLCKAGIDLESSGKFKGAIEFYLKAAGIDDEFADLQFRLARSYGALEQYDEAQKHFIKAQNFDALRCRADTRINKIIRNVAADGITKSIYLVDAEKAFQAESPHRIPGENFFYDHVHMNSSGNYLFARLVKEQVEKILGMESQDHPLSEAECAGRLAFTRWDRYRIKEEILRRMKSPPFVNQIDNTESVRCLEAKLDSMRTYLRPDALKEAVKIYRHAIEVNKHDWVLRNNFGLLLLEVCNDPVGAANQFRIVQRVLPFDYLTYNNLGLAFAQQGKLNEAIACYEEALRIKPDFSKAHFNLGEVLERQGKNDEAIKHFYRAHLTQQGLARAHNRYGKRLAHEDKIEEAIKQFEEALRLWPDFAEGHINLASQMFMQGNYINAVQHYKKALQLRPGLPEVHNNLGLALCKQGKFGKAIKHFQKALLSKRDFLAARNNMAGALSQLGRNEEAIVQLKEALRISPNNPDFYNNIGVELLKLGEIEEAITYFKKALQLKSNLPSARNNLKYALSQLKDSDNENLSKE